MVDSTSIHQFSMMLQGAFFVGQGTANGAIYFSNALRPLDRASCGTDVIVTVIPQSSLLDDDLGAIGLLAA